jgi:hypothetical protein
MARKANSSEHHSGWGFFWLGTAVTAVLALIVSPGFPAWSSRGSVSALIAAAGLSFSVAGVYLGWYRSPFPIGRFVRIPMVLFVIWFLVGSVGYLVWPPIRRHVLDQAERTRFEEPLRKQIEDRYELDLSCPSADESICAYAGQFIEIFREAGWKVRDNQVHRVTLGVPYQGIRLFSYVPNYPAPDAPVDSGVWTKISNSLITVYKSFSSIGIEANGGVRNDVPENVLTIYFGPEKADESKPTDMTMMYSRFPAIKQQYPKVKLP